MQHNNGITQRNYGIDLLRIISMLMIVILHILGHGGIVTNSSGLSQIEVLTLKAICLCSVNCFAMISGYVSYKDDPNEYKYGKYIKLWLEVWFYCVAATIIGFIMNPSEYGLVDFVKAMLPVGSKQYWYFSAYTGVFFLAPWINKFIQRISKKELTSFILMLFCIFSCFATISSSDPFMLESGASFLWLAYMYIVGAWVKKNAIAEKINCVYTCIGCFLGVILSFIFTTFTPIRGIRSLCYITPTILLFALALLVVCSKMKLNAIVIKVVKFASPASFAVYLIHDHPVIRRILIENRFVDILNYPELLVPILVIVAALIIMIICIIIEKVRGVVFAALNINRHAEQLVLIVYRTIERFTSHIIAKLY